jgi:uncharacterized protein (DUF362 family)
MKMHRSRREFLGAMSMAAGAYMVQPSLLRALPANNARVAIGRCPEYNRQVVIALGAMFDQLGGLRRMVAGKTVAIKLNMTAGPTNRLNGMPVEMTHWVHPKVIAAVVYLLGQAGARRIRLVESTADRARPLQYFMASAGWNPQEFVRAAPKSKVEFENTNFLGSYKTYATFMVPGGGLMYKGFDLNRAYRETDVFVSLAKLKEHRTAGITLSMKNCFGITPCTIYSQQAPVDEPSLLPVGYRLDMHLGTRVPPKSAPQPSVNPATWSHDPGYRVPRIVTDLVHARPIDLAVIDGIYTMEGGELPQQSPRFLHKPMHPGVLIAGLNCVSTDAVATAVMGFDPLADRGTPPFETCDSTLKLAEQQGLGTPDLSRIEVLGEPIAKVRCPFKPLSQLTRA